MYGVYHQLAKELGLQLSPEQPGMMTFAIDLAGKLEGHPVTLRRLCGSGARIDITSPLVPHLDLGFGFSRAGIVSRVSEWLGKRDIQVDDPDFDKAFTIRGDEPERVRALLGPELRVLLASNPASFEISDAEYTSGGRVGFAIEETYMSLVGHLQQAVRIARAVGLAHAAVPCAAALRAHQDVWLDYARANGFQSGSTPLWMQGKLGKFWVLARAHRNRADDFSLELAASFEQPLPIRLKIEPQRGALDALAIPDLKTGDARFDAVFDVVQATELAWVDPELRRQMLDLAQLGLVRVIDSRITLHTPATLEPAKVPAVLEDLRAVLVTLEKLVHGPNAAYR
jgi:hypothetical protein